MDESQQKVVTQTTISLPFLEEEVPVLYLTDGRPYIPVFAVCQALGIHVAMHIRRWRKLVLWVTARKLPFQTATRGKRLVWCLLISEVPFLYSQFNWKRVSPERCLQLRQAVKEQMKLAYLAYQQMQCDYKEMRQALFTFLTTSVEIDPFLKEYAASFSSLLESESSSRLSQLAEQGRVLYRDATAHARSMLAEQGELPVMDMVKIDEDQNVIDTFSLPLLPLVPREDRERFCEFMSLLMAWHKEVATFWNERGMWPDTNKETC
ncbi:MAG TPA: hypothetical protein DIU08_07260 [Ktedonobacter sp.]|nr:hypothetical protein [Ktedonobacter sp.]